MKSSIERTTIVNCAVMDRSFTCHTTCRHAQAIFSERPFFVCGSRKHFFTKYHGEAAVSVKQGLLELSNHRYWIHICLTVRNSREKVWRALLPFKRYIFTESQEIICIN